MSSLPDKEAHYYLGQRTDLLDWLGGRHERVLEVGCGAGGNARWLREHGATHLVGVEIHPESAERARAAFDHVESRSIEEALPSLSGPFDLIICADVLEHLVDPQDVVRRLVGVAAEHGRLLVSIPNIRYVPALMRIAVGAGFRPEPEGTFDATHLHFFTKENVRQLLTSGGWRPERWGYGSYRSRSPDTLSRALSKTRRALSRVTFGLSDEWLVGQWWVEATPIAREVRYERRDASATAIPRRL